MKQAFEGFIIVKNFAFPVSAYLANESERSESFKSLCPHCRTPTVSPLRCPSCDIEVDRKEILKGHKYGKDQYIAFTQDELADLDVDSNKNVELPTFVNADDIDPMRITKTYFLAPEQDVAREYFVTLRDAMLKTGMAGLGSIAFRNVEHPVAVVPAPPGFVMHVLRHDTDMRSMDEIDSLKNLPKADKTTLADAIKMVRKYEDNDFDMASLRDRRRELLEQKIKAKLGNAKLPMNMAKAETPKILGVMAAIKQNLAASKIKAVPKKSAKATLKKKVA